MSLSRLDIISLLLGVLFVWLFGQFLFLATDMPSQSLNDNLISMYWYQVGVLFVLLIAMLWRHKNIRLGKIDLLVLLLIVLLGVKAWQEGVLSPQLDECLASVILYISLRLAFQAWHQLSSLTYIVIFALGIYEGWLGIGQAFGFEYSNHGLFRITGSLFNPGPYGGLMAVVGICAIAYIVISYNSVIAITKNIKSHLNIPHLQNLLQLVTYILAILAAILSIIVLPATMSRAAWIAIGVAGVFVVFNESYVRTAIRCWCIRNRRRAIIISEISILCLIGVALWAYLIKQGSADGRLLMWKIDTRVMINNPFGVGLCKFAGSFGQEQAIYFQMEQCSEVEKLVAGCPEAGFNEYLQFGAETGILGFILLISLVILSIYRSISKHMPSGYSLMAMAVFALFSYPFNVPILRILFIASLAMSVANERDDVYFEIFYPRFRKLIKCFGLLLMILSLAIMPLLINRVSKYVSAQKEWQQTSTWQSSERYDYLVEDGAKLYDLLKYDYRFLYEYGYALHRQGEYTKSIEVLERGREYSSDPMFCNIIGKNYQALKLWDMAETYFDKAHYMIPSRIYPLYLSAKMYEESEQYLKAYNTANKALHMKIKVESEQTLELKDELQVIADKYKPYFDATYKTDRWRDWPR